MISFEEYLTQKKIDTAAFKKADPVQWAMLQQIFMQVHPKSFTAQKLYLINPLRRYYPVKEAPQGNKRTSVGPSPRPKPKTH